MKNDVATIDQILNRAVSEIIVESELRKLLTDNQPLRLKMGFDPSRPDIHLGYVVALRKLRALQELGHRVILIVGDWTAQIGDPSGQSATRIMLSHEEVLANAKTYMEQFFKVVDKERTDTVFQSEWFGKFKLEDVINLTSKFTVAQFLERDDFSKRYKKNIQYGGEDINTRIRTIIERYNKQINQLDEKFKKLFPVLYNDYQLMTPEQEEEKTGQAEAKMAISSAFAASASS